MHLLAVYTSMEKLSLSGTSCYMLLCTTCGTQIFSGAPLDWPANQDER